MRRIIVFAGGGGSEIFYFDEGGISLGEGVISRIWSFFSSIIVIEKFFFWTFLKKVLHSVNERQVIAHKKIEKYDGKNMFL